MVVVMKAVTILASAYVWPSQRIGAYFAKEVAQVWLHHWLIEIRTAEMKNVQYSFRLDNAEERA